MANTIAHNHQGRKGYSPLPVRDGLNPTRARVPADAPGITAWDFVLGLIMGQRHRHLDDNEAALEKRFSAGEVVLRNGTQLRPESMLKPEQDVYFYRTPAPEIEVPYDIPILFEDEHLLVADKPPFMATMPRARHIVQTATVQLRRQTGLSELSPAHRLDRLTSGVLLFTKTREVRGAYQTLFARREVHKTYSAIAAMSNIAAPTKWSSRIEKIPGEIQSKLVDGPLNSHTLLHAIEPLNDVEHEQIEAIHGKQPPQARYILKPTTGKTHQLRLHMWAAGVPILGDPVYPVVFPEDSEDMSVPMHLTARSIEFVDPLTGKPREFSTDRDLFRL
ncbi:MAG: pseudouridine synthase [Corynebacterium sp.]|nr:pseudouridine synthase [Corynebacterium sp.]